ncbi:DUF6301 family protein [Nocardia brasiliensis]|uniref:DUF6301 family protein n=1 Tax=Nocardia brasiliensis TaxID=37326 RepID=UPI0024573965|nr:DUF6301 family protein [Nocardia brasiliensis]
MSDSLKVDIGVALEFFRVAGEFDWTWGTEDVHRFSARMGWETAGFGTPSTIVMLTKARLEKPFARFQVMDGRIDQVALHLADVAAPSSRKLLADAFAAAAASLDELLGAPIVRVTDPHSKIFWNTPKFIGELLLLDIGLNASVCRKDGWGVVDELRARGIEL